MKSRQFEILIFLMKYKKSTYGEMAQEFGVSKKTIERDVDRLSGMGIPIYSAQGVGGGVFLDEKYQFSGSFFTPEEIHHIILALSVADNFTVAKRKKTIIQKLCLLDSNLTTLVEKDMKEYLTIDLIESPVDVDNEICSIINQCLDEEVLANINEFRDVACLEYVLKNDGLYLFGFSNEYILIKIEDIKKIQPTNIEFERTFLSYLEFKNKK